jgi:hypothetical protein
LPDRDMKPWLKKESQVVNVCQSYSMLSVTLFFQDGNYIFNESKNYLSLNTHSSWGPHFSLVTDILFSPTSII